MLDHLPVRVETISRPADDLLCVIDAPIGEQIQLTGAEMRLQVFRLVVERGRIARQHALRNRQRAEGQAEKPHEKGTLPGKHA